MNVYSEQFYRHPILVSAIIGFAFSIIIMIGLFSGVDQFNKVPTVERTVDSLVIADGYTECIFEIDGHKYRTAEVPCKYKTGETVKTKLFAKHISIINIIEEKLK